MWVMGHMLPPGMLKSRMVEHLWHRLLSMRNWLHIGNFIMFAAGMQELEFLMSKQLPMEREGFR